MKYILSNKEIDGCVFCAAKDMPDGPANLVVHRGKHAFVILNKYPYTSGHLMVVPYAHHATLTALDADTRAEMMALTNHCMLVLEKVYRPQGYNVGINIGAAAGAGIRMHVHMHIVPRWSGDTNFMASVGDTRVLPETLTQTYWRIHNEWEISES
jgi:ATP adenylyltransferase